MRKIHRTTSQLILAIGAAALMSGNAWAEDVQIQNGFQLPGVSLPSGHDEVRAADGTSCRSAISGGGAYLDIGVIGTPNASNSATSAYGRVVVPLGFSRKRIDCTKLYELEVQRLAMELKLMQMGLDRPVETPATSDEVSSADFEDGWSNEGQ